MAKTWRRLPAKARQQLSDERLSGVAVVAKYSHPQFLKCLFAFNNNCISKLMSFKLSLLGVDYAKEKNRDAHLPITFGTNFWYQKVHDHSQCVPEFCTPESRIWNIFERLSDLPFH
jgi:hypothetical protein